MAGKMPTHDQLMSPMVKALQELGGSGSIEEIYDKVVELEKLSCRYFGAAARS
jgi:restriction system protein